LRRSGAGEERLRYRAARVRKELLRAGLFDEVSPLGRRVFGIDV
jgi:hypothetical protein